MDRRLQPDESMTGLRLLALLTSTTIGVAALSGCGDNVDELAQARAAKKPTTGAKTAPPDEAVVPVNNSGTTLPRPGTGTTTPPGTGGACQPAAVTTLDVQWRPPHAAHMQSCTAQEAQLLAGCFFGNQGCDQQISALCHQCAVSSAAASSTYGAIIVDEGGKREPEPNVEGCVAVATGDMTANGCGARLRAKFGCESQACQSCDDTNRDACIRAADTGVCAAYSQPAASCMGSFTTCIGSATTSAQVALNLIQLFCM